MRTAVPVLAVLLLTLPARADDTPTLVFTNATIHTGAVDQPVIGWMAVKDGKVVAVHSAKDGVKFPAGAKVIDLDRAVVIPGLVDTHSHVGVYPKPNVPAHSDGNEMSGPAQPGLRALDAVWPADPGVKMALAGGVTTANIMPGSGNVIGGQTVYVKYRGTTVEDMRVTGKLPDGTEVLGGLKMANGENPKRAYGSKGQAPFTRMKIAALQREQFVKAKEYKAKKDAGEKVDRDLALEPLVEVLERKRTVHFHCHRADDILTALRIAEEFHFEIVLQHASEGYRISGELARRKVPVSLTLVDSPGGKSETIGRADENAAVLDAAGVPVTVNTDDSVTESRFYLRTAAIAVRGGLSEAAALRSVTSTAAKVLHLDHRLGSLEPGKDADFVVLSGPPFSVYAHVKETWIEGKKVFDAADEAQRPYRDGGWMLPRGAGVPAVEPGRPYPTAVAPVPAPPGKEKGKPGTVLVRAGRVHTAAGEAVANGFVLVEGGKVAKVGKLSDPDVPAAETVLTAAEVTPGLIDCYGMGGLTGAFNIPADQDQDEPSDPNQADLRTLDGFNPTEPLLGFMVANGITVVNACPGRSAVLAGTSGVFRTHGSTVDQSALAKTFAVVVNLGESPKETFKGKGPGTRMGVAAQVRKAFTEAQTYAAKLETDPKKTPRNPKLDGLLPALAGKAVVIFSAHRADDIQTALRIADEFKLKPVIALGTEAFLLADELAKRKVPVIVHPTMQRAGGSMETANTLLGTAAFLKQKGVPVTIGTGFEGYVPKTRNLRAEAAMAAANGLGSAAALQAVTLDAAKLLGIDKDRGSIAVGKVADLVLYDGDPFEHATHVTHTVVGGKVVFDRAEELKVPLERRLFTFVEGFGGVGCCLGW